MDPNQPNTTPETPAQPDLSPPAPQPEVQPTPQVVPGQVIGAPSADQQPVVQPQPIVQPSPQVAQPVQPVQPNPVLGSSPQPISGSQLSSSSSGRKKLLMIVAIVVGLALLAGGGYMLTKKGGSGNPVANLAGTITGNGDVVDRSDGTLDVSNLIDKQTTLKNQELKGKLNQQINLSDGTSYMVTSVERNFASTTRYLKAKSGKEIIKINVVVGNRNKEGNIFVRASSFKLINSAGGLLSPEYATEEDAPDALKSDSLAPGKQVSGAIFYEVDKDEKVSALVTEDKYKNYTTSEEITVKSEVSLQ